GATWFPIFDSVREVSSVGAVEVAPSNPRVIYVGTGDMITGSTLDQGNGMYKSTDAGATWQHLGLAGTRHIQNVMVDPRNADVVLVGALGDHVNANEERGVFRSTDGGKSWQRTLYVDKETGIAKLARAFDVPDVIFASTARHFAPPGYAVGSYRSWQFSLGFRSPVDTMRTGTALYKSLDGGATWQELRGNGLPRLEGRTSMAVAIGTNAQRVYLISNSALYRSDDGGANWRQMAADDERIRNGQGGYSAGVYVDPRNPDIVYTINTAAYKSIDGGAHFTGLKGAPGGDDPQQLWIDPTDGRRILMGLDQGATITLDGGTTWSSWYNQSTEQLYHLSADNSFPYWIYATQQDAGAIRTRIRGNLGAITMFDWNPVNGWEWGTVVADPKDPNTVFASGNGLVRISYPSEQSINVSPAIDPAFKARATNSQPLVWAPWDATRLFAGLHVLTTTTDGGATWKTISPDLGVPAGMDSAQLSRTLGGRGAIEAIAPSPVSVGTIWVGTNNGLIHLTRDQGVTWKDVSIGDLTAPRRANISAIEASHRDAGTAYVALEYMRIGDHRPQVYRTRDFGRTWTRIITGLPTDEPSGSFARVIREDPARPGLLFLGTESGVHVSFDAGDHWQSLQNDLPNSPVRDLIVKGNDLIIATYGRGLWVIDDISMLRHQRAGDSSTVALSVGNIAVRVRRSVASNTPLPPEIPHAENALDGAIIDYWLTRDAQQVALEVRDVADALVRRLTSDAKAPVAEAAKPPHPNFWVAPPLVLSTRAGAHRTAWDLRREAPSALRYSFEINANPGLTPPSPIGALVPPGRYTLRLIADGVTRTDTVVIVNDPRSRAPQAALVAQDAFQAKIATAIEATTAAQRDLEAVRAAITAGGAADAAVSAFATTLDSLFGGGARRAAGATFNGMHDTFVGLFNAQEGADIAPTPSMRAAFAAACSDLRTIHSAWTRATAAGLPALERAGRPKLTLRGAVRPPC
ncbi:MAG: hypothetical protein K2X99_04435, partial [Gemmatimonadaceae bacterium]|nr:hypothetical protein [Gemmatimonadaceae bacterium]